MRTQLRLLALFALSLALVLGTASEASDCNPDPVEPTVTCTYDGATYVPGDSFPATDGCNTCTCMDSGDVACTLMLCGCLHGGSWYENGESLWDMDACNRCSCARIGVGCTKIYCPCAGDEWFRDYASNDPASCPITEADCPESTHFFQNDCGCGCQQSPDCDAVYDCEPPTDCSDVMEACPYSTFAL